MAYNVNYMPFLYYWGIILIYKGHIYKYVANNRTYNEFFTIFKNE